VRKHPGAVTRRGDGTQARVTVAAPTTSNAHHSVAGGQERTATAVLTIRCRKMFVPGVALGGTDERIVGFIGAYGPDAEGCDERGQLGLDGLGWHVVWH
jgi:hypothetical protein